MLPLKQLAPLALLFASATATAINPMSPAEELLRRASDDNNSTDSSSGGFVNNGTVGTPSCALDATVDGQRVYSPDSVPGKECAEALPPVFPFNEVRIRSPDDSLRLTFMPYGASVKEVYVKDREGAWQDVILGFDNATNYGTDTAHNYFGPVVGRYANRIKNGTFELDGKTYKTPLNENNVDTLHGGKEGYDRASWQIKSLNDSSVEFMHTDPDGNQGFPGEVNTTVTYTLERNASWSIRMHATASKKTPLMLSSHVYWNLNPQSFNASSDARPILDHVVHMPYVTKYIKTDGILIPTGETPKVDGTAYDFRQAATLRSKFDQTEGVCGTGCQGWDSCWVEDAGHPQQSPTMEVYSPDSGIKLSITTNQEAWQIYTTAGLNGPTKASIPRKRAHGGDGSLDKIYENYSAMVIEAEDWIDAINNPEWGRNQIYGEGRDYQWEAKYQFSTVDQDGKDM